MRAVCLLIFFVAASIASGLDRPENDLDPATAVRLAVEKYERGQDSRTRFTYFELAHIQNFNQKGKKTVDYTERFEITYIADLEYSRLLEVNGKALSGKALKAEQKRYDDAVRERSALDAPARAKIQHRKMLDAAINLRDLVTQYRSSIVDQVTGEDCTCVVLDLIPVSSRAKKHYRLWIDPGTSEIRRVDFEQLADKGEFLSGGKGTTTLQYLDGVPSVVHSHIEGRGALNNQIMRVVADHTYSQYRKFTVTTTIVPVGSANEP